jgi:hypothetical protein
VIWDEDDMLLDMDEDDSLIVERWERMDQNKESMF